MRWNKIRDKPHKLLYLPILVSLYDSCHHVGNSRWKIGSLYSKGIMNLQPLFTVLIYILTLPLPISTMIFELLLSVIFKHDSIYYDGMESPYKTLFR
jgi:hypothetical protein